MSILENETPLGSIHKVRTKLAVHLLAPCRRLRDPVRLRDTRRDAAVVVDLPCYDTYAKGLRSATLLRLRAAAGRRGALGAGGLLGALVVVAGRRAARVPEHRRGGALVRHAAVRDILGVEICWLGLRRCRSGAGWWCRGHRGPLGDDGRERMHHLSREKVGWDPAVRSRYWAALEERRRGLDPFIGHRDDQLISCRLSMMIRVLRSQNRPSAVAVLALLASLECCSSGKPVWAGAPCPRVSRKPPDCESSGSA